MEEMFVGIIIVLVVAHFRFKEAHFQHLMPSKGSAGLQGEQTSPQCLGESGFLVFVRPPRANTTAIRYNLYKTAYMICLVLPYLAVVNIPKLQELLVLMSKNVVIVTQFIDKTSQSFAITASVAVVAVLYVLLLSLPIIRRAEESLRFFFYEHAAIPAQQRLVQSRLHKGGFDVDHDVLEVVRNNLEPDGFDIRDIEYQETPTTRSLWTKIAVLNEQINRMRGDDRYKTAFATIREPSSGQCLVDDVEFRYQALKGDAKACLKELRRHPEEAETMLREERFRIECHQLLEEIYRLVSLVALRSNFCECDVALCVNRLGFDIEFRPSPLPSLNDLLWLSFILFVLVAFPLLKIAELPLYKALTIEAAYFVSVLMPIIIAAEWPNFVRNSKYSAQNIAYPVLAGLGAAAAGAVIAIVRHAIDLAPDTISLMEAVRVYALESTPWAVLHFVLAGTLAFLLQFGAYPDIEKLKRINRYQLMGSLRDGIILCAVVTATVIFYVYPELLVRIPERAERVRGLIYVLPPLVAFIFGFIVPTWYRANASRLEMSWRIRHGKATATPGASPGAI